MRTRSCLQIAECWMFDHAELEAQFERLTKTISSALSPFPGTWLSAMTCGNWSISTSSNPTFDYGSPSIRKRGNLKLDDAASHNIEAIPVVAASLAIR